VQREGIVIHVVAERLVDLSGLVRDLAEIDGDFGQAIARADEIRRPDPGSRRVFPEARNFR
jgi:error-prone DNA polymerase